MNLDLIYKIVCEKGMNIHIRPAVMSDERREEDCFHGSVLYAVEKC